MPRRSGHAQSDENPTPRRQSARIAAVQAASPAKSPVKSPRRKRQSLESNKTASEDTESQQSQVKSEVSIEEINGLDTSSTKGRESGADSQELPHKKAKVDEENGEVTAAPVEEPVASQEAPAAEPAKSPVKEVMDFEVVEKSDIPPPDSDEVRAAVSVQGEDGQLLVDFVQVNKDELPSATSVEVKQVASEESELHVTSNTIAANETPVENSLNGDSNNHVEPVPTTVVEPEVQSKIPIAVEVTPQPILAPAAGDSTTDDIVSEPVP